MKIRKILAGLSVLLLIGSTPVQALNIQKDLDIEIINQAPTMPEETIIRIGAMTFRSYPQFSNELTLILCDSSLTSIEIPAEITDPKSGNTYPITGIDYNAFTDCKNLEKITVNENQKKYTSIDGALCSANGKELIFYPLAKSTESVIVPEGIIKIGTYAFNHHPAKEIILPDSCDYIDRYAFGTSLEKLHLGKDFRMMQYGAFHNCDHLQEITLSNGNVHYAVEDNVLYNKNKTELCLYPAAKPDTFFTVPKSVTKLGYDCLHDCSALEEILLPKGLRKIENNAFLNCINLKALTIPEGVSSLNDVGNGCKSLKSLYLPSTLEYVNQIFNNCPALEDIYFNNTRDYWYNLPNVVSTKILADKTLRFSDDDTYVNINIDGVDYRLYSDHAIVTGCDDDMTEIHIPEKIENVPVTEIHQEAFKDHELLTSVELPRSLTKIGEYAFYKSGLESIILPDSLTELGKSVFSFTAIKEITIPENITILESGMFYGCSQLESVHLPKRIDVIYPRTFYQCSSLKEIIIPERVTGIGNAAFMNCISLTEITLPEKVAVIGPDAFRECRSLKRITILNPECNISDSSSTICSYCDEWYGEQQGCVVPVEYRTVFYGTICGYENSTAQKYAEKYQYQFDVIAEGDVNADGVFSAADVILFQKWLLAVPDTRLANCRSADLYKDGTLNVFDLRLMKKALIENLAT